MPTIQPIHHGERLVAITVGDAAVLADDVDDDERRHVQAMALYAIKVAAGDLGGPYTDAAAERYATQTLQRADAPFTPPPRLRRHRQPPRRPTERTRRDRGH